MNCGNELKKVNLSYAKMNTSSINLYMQKMKNISYLSKDNGVEN